MIKRDTQTTHNRAVPPWEVPVLEYLFEDGNVTVTEVYDEVADGEYPDPGQEFHRLTQRYGQDLDSKLPYVALVYGNASVGVRALNKAILEAKAEDEAAESVAKPAPVVVAAVKGKRKAAADSLMG
jgi:hypothetical protein